jgi:hypothetical protein
MQVDRRAELFGAFQDRPEKSIVEVAAAAVAVDDGAGEFLIAYAARTTLSRTRSRSMRDELERSDIVEFLRLLLQVPAGAVEKSRRCKVLFERDGPHGR